jgi:hypothetical protein
MKRTELLSFPSGEVFAAVQSAANRAADAVNRFGREGREDFDQLERGIVDLIIDTATSWLGACRRGHAISDAGAAEDFEMCREMIALNRELGRPAPIRGPWGRKTQ